MDRRCHYSWWNSEFSVGWLASRLILVCFGSHAMSVQSISIMGHGSMSHAWRLNPGDVSRWLLPGVGRCLCHGSACRASQTNFSCASRRCLAMSVLCLLFLAQFMFMYSFATFATPGVSHQVASVMVFISCQPCLFGICLHSSSLVLRSCFLGFLSCLSLPRWWN